MHFLFLFEKIRFFPIHHNFGVNPGRSVSHSQSTKQLSLYQAPRNFDRGLRIAVNALRKRHRKMRHIVGTRKAPRSCRLFHGATNDYRSFAERIVETSTVAHKCLALASQSVQTAVRLRTFFFEQCSQAYSSVCGSMYQCYFGIQTWPPASSALREASTVTISPIVHVILFELSLLSDTLFYFLSFSSHIRREIKMKTHTCSTYRLAMNIPHIELCVYTLPPCVL